MKKMIIVLAGLVAAISFNLNPAMAQTVTPRNCVYFNAQYDVEGRVVRYVCAASTRQAALVPALIAADDPSRAVYARATEWTSNSSASPAYTYAPGGYGYGGGYGNIPPPPYDYRAEAERQRSLAVGAQATAFEAAMRDAADAGIRDGQHAREMEAIAGLEQSIRGVEFRLRAAASRRDAELVRRLEAQKAELTAALASAMAAQRQVQAKPPPTATTPTPAAGVTQATNAMAGSAGTTGPRRIVSENSDGGTIGPRK